MRGVDSPRARVYTTTGLADPQARSRHVCQGLRSRGVWAGIFTPASGRIALACEEKIRAIRRRLPKPATTPALPAEPADSKGRIFLIDAMSFIFRAYHAMAGSGPCRPRPGIPPARPTSSSTCCASCAPTSIRNIWPPSSTSLRPPSATSRPRPCPASASSTPRPRPTSTSQYEGYKANRAEMPADLAQQIPYIRRALEAYRIPILEATGFEADDVIGTLARKAADEGYSRLRRLQRQGHDAAGQRPRLGAQSAEGQPDLRPRQGARRFSACRRSAWST